MIIALSLLFAIIVEIQNDPNVDQSITVTDAINKVSKIFGSDHRNKELTQSERNAIASIIGTVHWPPKVDVEYLTSGVKHLSEQHSTETGNQIYYSTALVCAAYDVFQKRRQLVLWSAGFFLS